MPGSRGAESPHGQAPLPFQWPRSSSIQNASSALSSPQNDHFPPSLFQPGPRLRAPYPPDSAMHQASILANLLFPVLHLFLLFPQVSQPWAPTGGQAKDPKHAHLPPAGLDFKDSKKEKEKGLSFQCLPGTQPTALLCALLARSPAVPASPPQNIRSEDGPCLGSSCRLACPTQTSSRAHGCSSISPFRGITRKKGGQPPR